MSAGLTEAPHELAAPPSSPTVITGWAPVMPTIMAYFDGRVDYPVGSILDNGTHRYRIVSSEYSVASDNTCIVAVKE